MTREEIIDYCLTLDGAFKRYPFPRSGNPLIMSVYETTMFCVIYEHSDPLHIIVKCDPNEAELLRAIYPWVHPGYHFNKRHWNSIYVDESIPAGEIKRMIAQSHALVTKKGKRK